MGYMRHHCIVVTSWNEKLLEEAHTVAKEFFQVTPNPGFPDKKISEITPSSINGYASFLIAPDGSKEGWNTSDKGNEARDNFIAWIKSKLSIDWVEIQYGDDERETKITRHSR